MIVLLPPPQEIRYTGTLFKPSGREVVAITPGKEDATTDVLLPALAKVGGGDRVAAMELAGFGGAAAGAALGIANDLATARALARKAAQGLETPIPNVVVYRDGPCMPNEATIARQLAQSLGRHASDEAYYLLVEPRGIAICGRSRRGMFWGVQTLCQILAGSPPADAGELRRVNVPGMMIRDWPNQRVRGIHLDMKYFFQKPSAIEDWLRGLASLKINAALFEYEDKFPYEKYRFLREEAAMTPAELRRVLETARRYHVDVIPLIQSLGHLEYCLKHEELRGLRELPDVHTQACPTNPDALRFVTDMMDEVMAYHPDAELFHLGGDETGWLGRCPRCRKAARKKGNVGLYLDHIVPVLEHVLRRGRRPILWDDIVRTEPEKAGRIPRETVLGYWDYGPTREEHRGRRLPPILARFYRTQGRRAALWPDTLSFFPYFDFYQSKGFEVLAAPCLNYGTIVPDYVHSGRNTIKFAEKALACDGLGTINTQWACFRLPLGVSWYGYALTALCTWSAPPADTADFDVAFSRLFMGTDTAVLSEACAMVAEGVGFRVPGARRPFNLLHYAIMDAELHYPDGMRGRQKYGSNERAMQPDFARIVRRKLSLLRRHERRPDVLARMEWVASQMEAALHLLDCARPKTARGRRALEILRASGEFKLTRLHTMRLLMGERSKFKDARGALGAEQRCRKALENAYAHEVHPRQLPFEMDLLFDGEMRVLQGT